MFRAAHTKYNDATLNYRQRWHSSFSFTDKFLSNHSFDSEEKITIQIV